MAQQENIRQLALEILTDAEKKKVFVNELLHRQLYQKQFLSKQNRAFLTRLVEGVTEYQVQLDYIINLYSKKEVAKCKPFIRSVLRLGVYQMFYMDSVPDEAACDECVKLVRKKGFRNLCGFVNGILRNVSRNKEHISFPERDGDFVGYLSITYSMPAWIVEEFLSWYGQEQTEQILKASVQTADLTVRVNQQRISVSELKDKLMSTGLQVVDGYYVPEALHVEGINYVSRIPGFKEGEFFIQDESSMLLYQVSGAAGIGQGTLRILDLCAAPGGKCTQFAEKLAGRVQLEARDISQKKVALIEENIERMRLSGVEVKVADALVFDEEKRGTADIVIADLPCSGLGIMARKNDIKYHIRKEQLLELRNLQRTILQNAAEYVREGGILLYSTCTINPQENIENVEWALSHLPFEGVDFTMDIPEELRGSMQAPYALQLIPGQVKCDGFFIAKLVKVSTF